MWRAILYCVQEGLLALWRTKLVSLLSIGTMAISFTVLGLFLLVGENVGALAESYGDALIFHVFLLDESDDDAIDNLTRKFDEEDRISSYVFLDKDDAAERFNTLFPEDVELLAGLEENPLPASFEVHLQESARTDSRGITELVNSIGEMAGVESVRYDREWVDTLQSVGGAVLFFGLSLGFLLILSAIVTAANIIKINIYARQEEIEIMRLVGADGIYVRGPFVFSGLVQGLLASLLSLAALLVLHQLGNGYLELVKIELLGDLRLRFLPLYMVTLLISGGPLVGLLASLLSFGKAGRA